MGNNFIKLSKAAILALCVLLFGTVNSIGQQNQPVLPQPPSIIPPSPNAAAIEQFKTIPVSFSTGIPDISFPLWKWERNDLKINLSLSYHAGGVKIDDQASYVGLGWALNGLGSVNRTVVGLPDDSYPRGYIHNPPLPFVETGPQFDYDGHYFPRGPMPDSVLISATNHPFSYGIEAATKYNLDTEQDMFSFNTPTCNGRFVFNSNGEVVKLDISNVKIVPQFNIGNTIVSFTVTDEEGIEYTFSKMEVQHVYSEPQDLFNINMVSGYVSSWLLTKIKSPLYADEITISYVEGQNISYETGYSKSTVSGEIVDYSIPSTSGYNTENISYLRINSNLPVPSSIELPDGTVVTFHHNSNRVDLPNARNLAELIVYNVQNSTVKHLQFNYSYFNGDGMCNPNSSICNPRLRLDNIKELSNLNSASKLTRFEYNNLRINSPKSMKRDPWGYNINPDQTSQTSRFEFRFLTYQGTMEFPPLPLNVPDAIYSQAGILKKIIYPTGGYTQFEYENNTTFSPVNYYDEYLKIHKLFFDETTFNSTMQSLSLPDRASQSVKLFIKAVETGPRPAFNPTVLVGCLENMQDNFPFSLDILDGSSNLIQTISGYYGEIYDGKSYGLNLPLNNSYQIRFNYDKSTNCKWMFPFIVEISGDYLKEMTERLVGGLRIKSIKSYSGTNTMAESREYSYNDPISNLSSAQLLLLPNFGFYRMGIDRSLFHNGDPANNECPVAKTVLDYSDIYIHFASSSVNFINGSPIVYKFVSEKFLDGSKIERAYDENEVGHTGNFTLSFPFLPIQDFPKLSGVLRNEMYKDANGTLVKKKEYFYTKEKFQHIPDEATLLNPSSMRNLRVTKMAGTIGRMKEFCNYDGGLYKVHGYYYFSNKIQLDKETETDYSSGNSIIKENEFKYYNENLLESISTVNSKGETITKKYRYPFHSVSPAHQYLMLHNAWKEIIGEQELKKDLNGNSTLYVDKTMPFTFFGTVPKRHYFSKSILGSTPQVEWTAEEYDQYGNVLQYTEKDGITHSFIWAYKGQYPVVHVIGATYATVSALISNQSALENPTDPQLDNLFAAIRTGLANETRVTTYKCIPLVGIKEIADENGKKTFFEYDGFNRLKVTRDHEGNIIKVHEYEYAQ